MFQSTGWVLDEMHDKAERKHESEDVIAYTYPKEAEGTKYRSALIRRFDFTSTLMRMSVVCKNQIDNHYRVFTKGSPEKI